MTEKVRVTENGQVTIPKHIRDTLSMIPSTELRVTIINSSIILQKEVNEDIMSYSFLYNQITKLQYELSRQKELYSEQQGNIINLSIQVSELLETFKKFQQNKKKGELNGSTKT